jgi:hypothetical protein
MGVSRAGAILAVADVKRSTAFYSEAQPGHRCFAVDPDGYLVELEEPA